MNPCGIAVTPDGTKVYVANYGLAVYTNKYLENTVSVIDTTTNTVTATVKVGNCPDGIAISPAIKKIFPVANFTSNITSGNAPLNVSFTDKSTGTPITWKWSFGDGTSSTIQNPTHTYSKTGKYTVSLTATNSMGSNTATKSNYITVINAPKPPVAAFSVSPTSGKSPLSVKFTDKSTNNPTSWSWKFGDGGTSTTQSPSHKYTKKGTYSVSLTVKNTAGSNSITKSKYITVK